MRKIKKLLIDTTTGKGLFFLLLTIITMTANAQEAANNGMTSDNTDTTAVVRDTTFHAYLYNDEFEVMLDIDFYNQNVRVPGQDIFGELPGWFGSKGDGRKWLITDVDFNGNIAKLEIVNDYGSEDLTASLTYNTDGTYTLQQMEGSTLKIVVDRKWVKIPKKLILKRKKK